MEKFSLKLDKIKSKVDFKMILSFIDMVMGILRTLIQAKQGDAATEAE